MRRIALARRYRDTHFAIAKWDTRLEPLIDLVREAVEGLRRSAPFDVLNFPPDSATRFIKERGHVRLCHQDLEWVRLS